MRSELNEVRKRKAKKATIGKSWPACPHAQEDINVSFTAPDD